MKDFLGTEELDIGQATIIARAMYKVAEAEHGIHVQEQKMIDSFYLACCEEAGTEPEDLTATKWNPEQGRSVLTDTSLKEAMIRSCFLVGYADGQCSEVERKAILELAQDVGVDEARCGELDKEIKKTLLSQFESIQVFRDSAYDIGSQLGLTRSEVDEVLAEKFDSNSQ